tara:strand:- start:203 stop:463 length:261 start_codon:yes stop_codon:yes gene_type:complete
MWFNIVKDSTLELEGTNLEQYDVIKRNLESLYENIKTLHTQSRDSTIERAILVKNLTELEYRTKTLLELIGVVDSVTFEDQMRGKQ